MATISLDALRVLQVVAQEESFTRAAKKLRLDKTQVSRIVRGLETSLGVALFVRTTRSVRTTVEGSALIARIAPHIVEIEAAVTTTPQREGLPSGEVTITATPDLARAWLAPALLQFRARYPAVRVRVVLTSELVDLLRDGVDLALRVGRAGGQSLVARKLGELSAGFFAAPSYLQRRGRPATMADLATHEGLWPMPAKGQQSFGNKLPIREPAIECAEFSLLADCARLGGGVALLPLFLAANDVAAGALVRVLPEVTLGGAPLYLVSPPLNPLPARVRALRTFLLEHRWG